MVSAMVSSFSPWLLALISLFCCTLPNVQARGLVSVGPTHGIFNTSCSPRLRDQLQRLSETVEILLPAPGDTTRGWRSERAYFLESTNIDWRPLFVLGVGEVLGHIVRGVTGFGSAIVLVSFWTICKTAGLDAGPFQSLIFADSICALATAAPLVYITKPWKFASWRLVVTLLAFQAIGAPVGAYLVVRLEPAPLNFAIATALLVLFLLMVCPLEECIRRLQAPRAQPRPAADLTRPLLAVDPESGSKSRTPWWRRWLQRRRVTHPGNKSLPAGVPAGDAAAPDQAAAKSGAPAVWPPSHGVPSPFQDASQQQQEQQQRFVFSDNPLLLNRKQSDSASSLRAVGGSSPPAAGAKRRISISEHPDEAGVNSGVNAEGTVVGSLGGTEERVAGEPAAGTSGVDARSSLQEGGPGVPVVTAGGTLVAAEGASGSGGSESGDSDLAQTASAELGGVVIGIMPDSQLSRSARLVDRSASQRKAAEWSMDTRTLVGSAAVAATCSGMLSALSGIGGPPLILMFQLLAVPKRVVRATMVTTSIVSIKFFTYLIMGSAHTSNIPMYCLGIVSAYIGLNIGNALAKRMNQQVFGKVLLGVMLLSTCLLYASSFGLTQH